MKESIRYIELKSGFSDNGPAWIAKIKFSKSGQTVYFNGMALKKLKRPGIAGNYYDIETGEEYWISGVKINGQDRHWAGGGKIFVVSVARVVGWAASVAWGPVGWVEARPDGGFGHALSRAETHHLGVGIVDDGFRRGKDCSHISNLLARLYPSYGLQQV